MKQILLFSFFTLSMYINGQVNCPLNTPEFPFETQDANFYSWSSGLYMPSQFGGAQTFTNISFRLDNVGAAGSYTYTNVHVWMRHTTVTSFTTQPNYPGNAGFTEVYSGNFTFNGTGVKTFNFNVAPSFAFNGIDNLEVLFEFRGGDDNTWYEPWFDRTNARTDAVRPGKVGQGFSWANAMSNSSLRQFNLQINNSGCGAYPLGVSFTKSDLKCNGENVNLNWSVASEENNDFYTIESSINGRDFEIVKTIKGAGTTTNPLDYNVVLSKTSPELMYYRLSQTDFDGKHTILVTHAAQCNGKELKVSPNPFNDFFTIYTDKDINQLSMTNALGENIKISKTQFDNRLVVNTESLKNGVYFLTIIQDNETKIHRLIKN